MPAEPSAAALGPALPLTSGSSRPQSEGGTAGRAWAGLCGLTAVVHLGSLYLARDLRVHLPAQLALWLLAGLCWLLALGVLRRAPLLTPGSAAARRALLVLWTVALLMRIPALALPVGHSDDVYRYLWDGAVQHAGLNPYAGPPDDPGYAGVRVAHAALPDRINHRHLPTIYPPVAQLAFAAHAALSQTMGLAAAVQLWKGLVVVADLAVLALLVALCRSLNRDVRWAAVWGVAPLPAMELAYNGHLESLGILPLMLALWLWQRAGWNLPGQQSRALPPTAPSAPVTTRQLLMTAAIGALMTAAVLVKPVAGAVLPAMLRLPRRALFCGVGGALLAATLAVVPYGRSGALPPSLGEYGRRWRSNDGAYAGLLAVTQVAVDRLYRPPYYAPWRWPRLARALTGRDRDTVWPDELAGALVRGGLLVALGALTVLGVRRRLSPIELGLLLLLGYQLLTPVLHPWYELWPLALAALWPRLLWPVVAMAALAPLADLPLVDYFAGRGFAESGWPRLVQHGAGWAALVVIEARTRLTRSLGAIHYRPQPP